MVCLLVGGQGVASDWPVDAASYVVKSYQVPVCYSAIGTLTSDQEVDVSSRILGYLKSVKVREGDTVSKGQLLATVDDSDVEANILNLQAKLNQANNAHIDAKLDEKKYAVLFKSGSVTENQYRKIQLAFKLAQDNLEAAQAGLNAAKAQINYTHIVSPIDGTVTKLHQYVGELASPGQPIVRVESTDHLYIKTYVPERYISQVKPEGVVSYGIDALASEKYQQGVVSRIIPYSPNQMHRYEVHVSSDRLSKALPGMFAHVNFWVNASPQVVIPAALLVEKNGLTGVYILQGEKKVFRWLRVGKSWGDAILVKGGLKAGDTILTDSAADFDSQAFAATLDLEMNENLCR